jgi:hypothetical protein
VVHCDIYESSYDSWIHPLHHSILSSSPPFLEESQQVSFFHLHTWVSNISTTFTSFTLSYVLPPLVSAPDRTRFCLPVLRYWKKRYFCLFNLAYKGVSLWHFHVYMYYNLSWFFPSIFLLSILIPFLWWFHLCDFWSWVRKVLWLPLWLWLCWDTCLWSPEVSP